MLLTGSFAFSVAYFKSIEATVYGNSSSYSMPSASTYVLCYFSIITFPCVILHTNGTIAAALVKYTALVNCKNVNCSYLPL